MRKQFTLARIQLVIVVVACISILGIYVQNRPVKEIYIASTLQENSTLKPGIQLYNPIDFDAYWNINEDVYAYIYIKDTRIDYPILQHPSDNSHYLNYTIDGIQGYPGSVYSEKETAKDFQDNVTILYGHNMTPTYGTMFSDLMNYEDKTYFDEHNYIYIYTPDKIVQYQVFAAYPTDNRHLLYTYDFTHTDTYQAYLDSIFNRTSDVIANNLNVTSDDKILTLSTCTNVDNDRFLVHAVRKETIACTFKNSVTSNFSLKNAKEPDSITVQEPQKPNKEITFKPQFDSDMKIAMPYVLLIMIIIGTYLMMLHIQHRSKDNQAFYDIYVKGIRNKFHFALFLILQAYKDIKKYILSMK